jgi:hypothetical protein
LTKETPKETVCLVIEAVNTGGEEEEGKYWENIVHAMGD